MAVLLRMKVDQTRVGATGGGIKRSDLGALQRQSYRISFWNGWKDTRRKGNSKVIPESFNLGKQKGAFAISWDGKSVHGTGFRKQWIPFWTCLHLCYWWDNLVRCQVGHYINDSGVGERESVWKCGRLYNAGDTEIWPASLFRNFTATQEGNVSTITFLTMPVFSN